MAQHAAANRSCGGFGMAALARASGRGQRDSQRNRITDHDGSAATGISPDEKSRPSIDLEAALSGEEFELRMRPSKQVRRKIHKKKPAKPRVLRGRNQPTPQVKPDPARRALPS